MNHPESTNQTQVPLGGGNVYFPMYEPVPLSSSEKAKLWVACIVIPFVSVVGVSFCAGYAYAKWVM